MKFIVWYLLNDYIQYSGTFFKIPSIFKSLKKHFLIDLSINQNYKIFLFYFIIFFNILQTFGAKYAH
jgi:hypothetical protein